MKSKEQEILDSILREVPVGYIPNHIVENLPELVAHHVKRSGMLGSLQDEADTILKDENCSVKDFIRFMNRLVELEI